MKLETISHPTVGAETFCRASGVRYVSWMVQQPRSAYQLPPWQLAEPEILCVLATTLQLQFTAAAGCCDLRGPRRGCRMVAWWLVPWLEPALGHIQEHGWSWSLAGGAGRAACSVCLAEQPFGLFSVVESTVLYHKSLNQSTLNNRLCLAFSPVELCLSAFIRFKFKWFCIIIL